MMRKITEIMLILIILAITPAILRAMARRKPDTSGDVWVMSWFGPKWECDQ